jgi:predicted branched-subunit amino acid permease
LLTNSILPLGYCLFAMQLLVVRPEPVAVWRICSGAAFICDFTFGLATRRGARRLPTAEYRSAGSTRVIYLLFALAGSVAGLLQLVNLFLNSFWPFFTTIFVHLIAGAFQFIRMITPRNESTS